MKEWLGKIWSGVKSFCAWIRRVFEEKDGTPSSKRIFGAFLIITGVIYAIKDGDPLTVGILLGAGLGMFGVSSWSK